MTYPDGEAVNLGYDAQGQLISLQDPAAPFTYVRSVLYDEAGRMTSLGLGESGSAATIQRSYTYYPWSQSEQGGRLSGLSSINALSSSLQQLGYQYDQTGNITQISDTLAQETSAFSYDSLERLTGMAVTDSQSASLHSEAFTYDAAGRMSAKGPDLQSLTSFSYDSAHPHAVAALGTNSYTYDANGNQVARNLPGGEFSLTHDAENHLIEVQVTNQPAPTATATPSATPTEAPTATPTETPTEIPGTPQGSQPGAAKVAAARLRLQEIDTPTPTEEMGETPAPTETQMPTAEPSETAQPTASQTPSPLESVTPTEVFTETATETPTPTETATETATPTPSETPALKSGLAEMKSGMSVFQSAYYIYDGDGNLMRGTVNGRVTFYPGRQYNQVVEGSTITVQKFYALGSLTIAVRTIQGTQDTLNWVLSDHLGSTSVTANADGSWNSTLKYTAFGEVRSEEGSTPTEYKYTGQLEQAEIGLYYYVARWYDSELAHFVQADTIVPEPGDAAAWDRFAYTLNNPIRFNDPSGHFCQGGDLEDGTSRCLRPASQSTTLKEYTTDERRALIYKKGIFLSQAEGDDSLIKFGELVSYASTLYDDKTEVNEFVLDLTCAINNYCIGNPLNVWKAGFGSKYPIGDPRYFLNEDFFVGQGSWSNSYYDNTDNQMYHFWFYVAVSYFDTLPVALAGNYYHDPVYVYQYIENDPLIEADNGISIEDFNLGYAGAYLGLNLRLGSIRPSGVGNWITENLSQQNNVNVR